MTQEQPKLTILILENRQMIAEILADLLQEAGYYTQLFFDIDQVRQSLLQYLPALLLVDLGMIREKQQAIWQELRGMAGALDVPVLGFACSPLPGHEGLLLLRSPGDFAVVVDRVEQELLQEQPILGMTLVHMGLLDPEELEVVLRMQKELAQIGRQHSLGELLSRLSFITTEALERALQKQEH